MSLISLLERLSELFPKQDFQSRMDRYLTSKNPQTCADVEHWSTEYMRNSESGLLQ